MVCTGLENSSTTNPHKLLESLDYSKETSHLLIRFERSSLSQFDKYHDRMSEYRERKPTSKVLFARVQCQQRNARTNAILSVFPKPRESVSLPKSCYVAGSITSQYFPYFLNLSESCREKAVFVQRHNTSLHSKFGQTALKLTPKGLDYTQINTLRQPCITDL